MIYVSSGLWCWIISAFRCRKMYSFLLHFWNLYLVVILHKKESGNQINFGEMHSIHFSSISICSIALWNTTVQKIIIFIFNFHLMYFSIGIYIPSEENHPSPQAPLYSDTSPCPCAVFGFRQVHPEQILWLIYPPNYQPENWNIFHTLRIFMDLEEPYLCLFLQHYIAQK